MKKKVNFIDFKYDEETDKTKIKYLVQDTTVYPTRWKKKTLEADGKLDIDQVKALIEKEEDIENV